MTEPIEPHNYAPTGRDELRRLRYTLFPTLYTDEDSTSSELLWQLVIEQRATRWTLVWLLLVVPVLVALVVLALTYAL